MMGLRNRGNVGRGNIVAQFSSTETGQENMRHSKFPLENALTKQIFLPVINNRNNQTLNELIFSEQKHGHSWLNGQSFLTPRSLRNQSRESLNMGQKGLHQTKNSKPPPYESPPSLSKTTPKRRVFDPILGVSRTFNSHRTVLRPLGADPSERLYSNWFYRNGKTVNYR